MDQHNFEITHFKCTIPAKRCIIPVLLYYVHQWFDKVHASKRRLRWKKKQYATCALDTTFPTYGGGGRGGG